MQQDEKKSYNKIPQIFSGPMLKIAYCALFMVSVANLGFAFMDTSSDWYRELIKPALMPPELTLPIAWTALCALYAASMSLVGISPGVRKKTLVLYAIGAMMAVLFIYVFFFRHNAGGAVFLLIAIIAAAALLYSDSYRTSRAAAYLLIPYILFLCYALYLNYEIAFFNNY